MQRVQPVPPDQTAATPYLSVRDAARALDFYARAFGATVEFRLDQPDGRVGHAELAIGQARFKLADEFPELDIVGPQTLGNTTVGIHLYVEDVDALVARATAAGATLKQPVKDEFFGDRVARIVDPFGHRWTFCSRIEAITDEEIQRRAAALFAS